MGLSAVMLAGCGGAEPAPAAAAASAALVETPAPKPPAPPMKDQLATGTDCLKAESECTGGVCNIAIKNTCDRAVSCDASMVTTCKSGTTLIEGGRRKRDTFAAGTDGTLSLHGDCAEGTILATRMKSIACK